MKNCHCPDPFHNIPIIFCRVPCVAGSRLFLNVREKLLQSNISTIATLSTFEMRPPAASGFSARVELDVLESNDQSVHMSVITDLIPDSATTLVPKHNVPWA